MRICEIGIWDETVPGIVFDDKGICNYCHLQHKMMKDYPRGDEGKKNWDHIIEKIKESAIGKSDSTENEKI